MSIRTDLEDGLISWLTLAGAAAGIPNADEAVIPADEDGERPDLPYLVVRVLVYDVPFGEDDEFVDDATPPVFRGRGQRSATVSVNAFGADAEAWLERAVFTLRYPAIKANLTAAGLAVEPVGGLNNLSSLLDDRTQVRFQRDFTVAYERTPEVTDTDALVELAVVEHEDTFVSGPAPDRLVTVTETL